MSNNTDLVRPELAPGGIFEDLFLPQQDNIVEHKQHPKKFPLGYTHYVNGMERKKGGYNLTKILNESLIEISCS